MKRDGFLGEAELSKACAVLESQPPRRVAIGPEPEEIKRLAAKWCLRTADPWHLTLTATLARELPENVILTFDQRLREAA